MNTPLSAARRLALLAVLLFLAATPLLAQQNIDRLTNPAAVSSATSSAAEAALQAAAATPSDHPGATPTSSPILPKVWCGDINDAPTKAVCWKAYRASLNYYETGLAHRARVFTWQHISTIVIFFTVLALVAAGIFFAWLQFNRDRAAPEQSLELSATGLKLTSPVLGVVILALSLGFFYLYLVYVYPIHELF